MSSHYKFEVHIATPGERDDEDETVEQFARLVQAMAKMIGRDDLAVVVGEVERN